MPLNLTAPSRAQVAAALARPLNTEDEMTTALVKLLWEGQETITEADLQRLGFSRGEIAEHRDAAISRARKHIQMAQAH